MAFFICGQDSVKITTFDGEELFDAFTDEELKRELPSLPWKSASRVMINKTIPLRTNQHYIIQKDDEIEFLEPLNEREIA